MTNIQVLAQQAADSSGSRCWVVVPRDGQPYIAYRAGQIAPSYEQLITVLPAAGYSSRWDSNNRLQ
jgi:hypothetical protein